MNRKNEVRRQNISSEFRNAFVVRNKCEQLKLEQQHKSLDRLREHENLNFTNKRKEILSLQMSILFSKPDDNSQEFCSTQESLPSVTATGTRKIKYRSRVLSTCASSINLLLGGSAKDQQIGSNSVNFDKRKMHPFKKMSRSVSVSGSLGFATRKKSAALQNYNNDNIKGSITVSCAAIVDESSSGQTLRKLLPPIQLTPVHKQKSKSLKELSSQHLEMSSRKLSIAQEEISRSWNDLQECRYLRRTSKQHDTCLES